MNPVNPTRVIGGRYVVLGELGRGDVGVVWRAEDRVMGRQVAVKELHMPGGQSREELRLFRERLLREARAAGRINNPGVVTVYDVLTDLGADHVVTELIEAPTLAEVVATRGPLDEKTVTAMAVQMLAALRAAHDAGVLHRDIKPSNVMLGPGDRVRIADFGIAQAVDDPRLTTTGALAGTPAYVAPERLEGGEATAASDLWSLGATLLYALRGESPFERETTADTIAAVLRAEIPPVRTKGPLGTVVAGLLQRPPQDRLTGPQAAALLAGPAEPVDAAAPARSPRRWWMAVAAALVLGLAAGVAGGAVLTRSPVPDVRTLSYGQGGDLPVFGVRSDSCVTGRLVVGSPIPSSAQVDCSVPHDLEVFRTFDVLGDQRPVPYPGRDELDAYGAAACGLVFTSALIDAPDRDSLEAIALVPTQAAFEASVGGRFPDREVICVLHASDGEQLIGSRIASDSG